MWNRILSKFCYYFWILSRIMVGRRAYGFTSLCDDVKHMYPSTTGNSAENWKIVAEFWQNSISHSSIEMLSLTANNGKNTYVYKILNSACSFSISVRKSIHGSMWTNVLIDFVMHRSLLIKCWKSGLESLILGSSQMIIKFLRISCCRRCDDMILLCDVFGTEHAEMYMFTHTNYFK